MKALQELIPHCNKVKKKLTYRDLDAVISLHAHARFLSSHSYFPGGQGVDAGRGDRVPQVAAAPAAGELAALPYSPPILLFAPEQPRKLTCE
jgi:hypothetical protein